MLLICTIFGEGGRGGLGPIYTTYDAGPPSTPHMTLKQLSSAFRGFLIRMVYLYNDIVRIHHSGRKPSDFASKTASLQSALVPSAIMLLDFPLSSSLPMDSSHGQPDGVVLPQV